jgi:hypothetical protein
VELVVLRVGFLLVWLGACSDTPGPATDAGPVDAPTDAPTDAATASCPTPTTISTSSAPELLVIGDPGAAQGIFDPTIVYPADAAGGAMAYSAVPDQESIRTRIAVSADHGATWTYVAEANVPEATTIASSDPVECPGGACSGKLISEVSSLIYDADDPQPARRWKLFAHRYLVGPGVALHYRIGTIALQTAAQPQGPWSAPQKLIGWNSPSAYSSTGVVTNASSFARTADCIALTEPGALWLPGSIHLAMGCVYIEAGAPKIRIELVRSTDHGASWISVATLLEPEDAACLTANASINASELFTYGGKIYVSATPSDNAGYHGCIVFPFEDFASGKVARDTTGRAFVTRTIVPAPSTFSGACAFAEGAGGFSMIVGFLDQARRFRIFKTNVATP